MRSFLFKRGFRTKRKINELIFRTFYFGLSTETENYFSKSILFAVAVNRSASINSFDDFTLWWISQRVSACMRLPSFEKCALISEKDRSIIVVTVGHLRSRLCAQKIVFNKSYKRWFRFKRFLSQNEQLNIWYIIYWLIAAFAPKIHDVHRALIPLKAL